MDTNVLISEVAQLYNQAAAARQERNEDDAKGHLATLRNLLNRELPAPVTE